MDRQIHFQVLRAIRKRKHNWDEKKAEHEARLLEECVVLKWLASGRPDKFNMPSFESWGFVRCKVEVDEEDGLKYIHARTKKHARPQIIDVQDVLYRCWEAHVSRDN